MTDVLGQQVTDRTNVDERAHFSQQSTAQSGGAPGAHSGDTPGAKSVDAAPLPRWRRWLRIAFSVLCWFYLIGVLGTWLFIEIDGDRWWRATMILFGPRWTLLLPLIVLVPFAILLRRRWLWALAGIALLIAGPMMDLRITRPGLFPPDRSPGSLRVLTFNTHYTSADPLQLKALIDTTKPDIVALQEWYQGNRNILFPDPSWHTIQLNEAMLASPHSIRWDGSSVGGVQITAGVTYHYSVELPTGALSFYSVHLESPHVAFRNVLHLYRGSRGQLQWNSNERLREARSLRAASDDDTILAGDFNLPRDSTIFRSQLSDFTDAFTVAGLGYGLTYYSPWTAVRIDHILMGKNWKCDRCWVGPDIGSPHRPVIADLERAN